MVEGERVGKGLDCVGGGGFSDLGVDCDGESGVLVGCGHFVLLLFYFLFINIL